MTPIRAARLALLIAAMALASAPARSDPEFDAWRAAQKGRAGEIRAFEAFLSANHVRGVLATEQLLRNASSWAPCHVAAPWSVPPRPFWPNIVPTLRLVRDIVVPAVGPVRGVSGYRDEALNRCAGGAPQSAHHLYFALDLEPVPASGRRLPSQAALIRLLCRLHARAAVSTGWGLGFYSGLRFHVDTKQYRLWGADGHRATSPCLAP